ncbi:MAG: glutamate synthase subunit alpha, partial [Candidatus Methanomethylophilaceae archaeon]|nr:glutamate synthase subunit alpha [Candidatus Methanomethylophilaceae archaeon]
MNPVCGLYDPADERDSCGVGMVIRIDGSASHGIVDSGLKVLENLAHRGAENADGCTGDGSGITIQIPHDFILKCGMDVPEAGRYGTGLLFLPKEDSRSEGCLSIFRQEAKALGLKVIGERDVPVDHNVPGPLALETEPRIVQMFLSSYDSQETLEKKLYLLRKHTEKKVQDDEFYICSLSTKTIV